MVKRREGCGVATFCVYVCVCGFHAHARPFDGQHCCEELISIGALVSMGPRPACICPFPLRGCWSASSFCALRVRDGCWRRWRGTRQQIHLILVAHAVCLKGVAGRLMCPHARAASDLHSMQVLRLIPVYDGRHTSTRRTMCVRIRLLQHRVLECNQCFWNVIAKGRISRYSNICSVSKLVCFPEF